MITHAHTALTLARAGVVAEMCVEAPSHIMLPNGKESVQWQRFLRIIQIQSKSRRRTERSITITMTASRTRKFKANIVKMETEASHAAKSASSSANASSAEKQSPNVGQSAHSCRAHPIPDAESRLVA